MQVLNWLLEALLLQGTGCCRNADVTGPWRSWANPQPLPWPEVGKLGQAPLLPQACGAASCPQDAMGCKPSPAAHWSCRVGLAVTPGREAVGWQESSCPARPRAGLQLSQPSACRPESALSQLISLLDMGTKVKGQGSSGQDSQSTGPSQHGLCAVPLHLAPLAGQTPLCMK